jgi:hypothetical protein
MRCICMIPSNDDLVEALVGIGEVSGREGMGSSVGGHSCIAVGIEVRLNTPLSMVPSRTWQVVGSRKRGRVLEGREWDPVWAGVVV